MSRHGKHLLYDCPYCDRKNMRRCNLNLHILGKHSVDSKMVTHGDTDGDKMVTLGDMIGGMPGGTMVTHGGMSGDTSGDMHGDMMVTQGDKREIQIGDIKPHVNIAWAAELLTPLLIEDGFRINTLDGIDVSVGRLKVLI